jgi:hypothetical protein
MNVTIEIPHDLAAVLTSSGQNLGRVTLEDRTPAATRQQPVSPMIVIADTSPINYLILIGRPRVPGPTYR